MFKEEIRSTALTTTAANNVFRGRIDASQFRGDVSMAAMARILFDQRLGDGEQISIETPDKIHSVGNIALAVSDYGSALKPGKLYILNVNARREESGSWKSSVKANIPKDLYLMDDLEKWFEMSKIQAVVLTDRPHDPAVKKSPVDNTKTLVVMENMNTIRWHLIASLLPRLLGKWFMEKPRTEFEVKNILCGIVGDSPDTFLEAVSQHAKELDFRSETIRKMLGDFEGRLERKRIEELKERSASIEGAISNHSEAIGQLLEEKETVLAEIFGYQVMGKKSEPITMNYFLANKNLFLQRVTDRSIEFYSIAWLSNWDPDKADATFGQNHCSAWLKYNRDFGISNEDAKRLYRAIFLTEEAKVRLWSHYKLNISGGNPLIVESSGPCSDIENALPNPHHRYNTCMGDNRRYVNECIIHGDVVGAVEQCISATAGINLMEHVSYGYFTKDIFDPSFGKVIFINELDKFVTTEEAIQWLKEKDGKTEEETSKPVAKAVAKEEEHV